MKDFSQLASDQEIQQATAALNQHGILTELTSSGKEARQVVLELIPSGAEVLTMTSVTLDTIGVSAEINDSGRYNSVRKKLRSMNPTTDRREMARIGSAADWSIGSVHAVTLDGQLLIASRTGSQMAAAVHGAAHVIFVVGAQKVVADQAEGMQRIYNHSFPLEDERALKAYGEHSSVNKLLIINQETIPHRITVIMVKEKLGF